MIHLSAVEFWTLSGKDAGGFQHGITFSAFGTRHYPERHTFISH